jgi:Ca2+-binding EF-hand superfamily protein
MKTSISKLVLTATVLAAAASFSLPSMAQEIKREEMVTFFQTPMIDANKDGMVSKKEFMDAMAKAWDMHMAEAKKADPKMPKDKMTLPQYIEFSKMFGLNVGA